MITIRYLSLNFFMLKNSLNCNNRGWRGWWRMLNWRKKTNSEFLSFAIFLQTKPRVTLLVTQAELTKKTKF